MGLDRCAFLLTRFIQISAYRIDLSNIGCASLSLVFLVQGLFENQFGINHVISLLEKFLLADFAYGRFSHHSPIADKNQALENQGCRLTIFTANALTAVQKQ